MNGDALTGDHDSADPRAHTEGLAGPLQELVEHVRHDVQEVSDTRAQALLETVAGVLTGLRKAFIDFGAQRGSLEVLGRSSASDVAVVLAPAISTYDAGMKAFLAGAIQMHVLHHAAEHEIHGAWMTTELARHGHRVSPGTLYPALHRMEAAGLLTGRDAQVNSRRVRYYSITGAGRTELASSRETLQQLADELLRSPRKRATKPPT